jgi:hypothetical protein
MAHSVALELGLLVLVLLLVRVTSVGGRQSQDRPERDERRAPSRG